MSNFRRCEMCEEYDFMDKHKCPPIYEVYHEEYCGDEWQEIRAWSEESAAENYGKKYNENGDYSLMNDSIKVKVRMKGQIAEKVFEVSAEQSINYSTHELDADVEG